MSLFLTFLYQHLKVHYRREESLVANEGGASGPTCKDKEWSDTRLPCDWQPEFSDIPTSFYETILALPSQKQSHHLAFQQQRISLITVENMHLGQEKKDHKVWSVSSTNARSLFSLPGLLFAGIKGSRNKLVSFTKIPSETHASASAPSIRDLTLSAAVMPSDLHVQSLFLEQGEPSKVTHSCSCSPLMLPSALGVV